MLRRLGSFSDTLFHGFLSFLILVDIIFGLLGSLLVY